MEYAWEIGEGARIGNWNREGSEAKARWGVAGGSGRSAHNHHRR